MAHKQAREREFARWPKYRNAYLLTFEKMLQARTRPFRIGGTDVPYATAQDVFNWWMEYDVLPGQITFDDYEEEDNG
jgi:phosphoadenosine phosphosulfate reductase